MTFQKARVRKSSLISIGILLLLSGCVGTRYVDTTTSEARDDDLLSRTVQFQLTNDFYKSPPDCVFIVPSINTPVVVEDAIVKSLSIKFPRVIEGREVRHLVRTWAVDIQDPRDRKTFARLANCGYALETGSTVNGNVFAVVWSQSKVGGAGRLTRAKDGKLLWKGYHVAERSDGGLPLSPFSFVAESFSASRFASDQDVNASLADDWARRLFSTIPDVRPYSGRVSDRYRLARGEKWK